MGIPRKFHLILVLALFIFSGHWPLHAQTVIDFQGVNASAAPGFVDATTYLAQFGITLSNVSPGTQVVVLNNNFLYGGNAAVPTHSPNLMVQVGSNDPVSFTMNFAAPVSNVTLTRPELVAGPNGITHPIWSAHAFDQLNAGGTELSSVGEGLIASFSNVPAATFTLPGSSIQSVRIDSNNLHFAAFSAVLIGEITFVAQPGSCQVNVSTVKMADSHTLQIDAAGQFSQDPSTPKSLSVQTTLNGVNLSQQIALSSNSTGNQTESFLFNLSANVVPRFTDNARFTVTATQNENGDSCSNNAAAVVLLPAVLIPGIAHPVGGDGTFGSLETFLTATPLANLKGEPYRLRQNPISGTCSGTGERYPTLYTLSYDGDKDSFSRGADRLLACLDDIAQLTWADAVNLVGHSKGALVGRQFLADNKLLITNRTGAQSVTRLIMAESPHTGALLAPFATFSQLEINNLSPLWPFKRQKDTQPFRTSPNAELDNLNNQPLPAGILYTILFSTNTGTWVTQTGKTPDVLTRLAGDGLVPAFSQRGLLIDPNDFTKPPQVIPAFAGVPMFVFEIDGFHGGYFDVRDVQSKILNQLTCVADQGGCN